MTKKLMLALALACPLAADPLLEKAVAYKDGRTGLNGFLAQKDLKPKPGVLIIHQWMGLTDYEKGRARQLADLGYAAFAADIYGAADSPKDSKGAGASAGKYKGDRKLFRSRIEAALKAMASQEGVDKNSIAVIGYCFGGTGALEAARAGFKVSGVASFHGGLAPGAGMKPAKSIKCPVLVLHGAEDPWVKAEEVAAFEEEMRQAKADWQLVKYAGAVHAFTQKEAGDDPSKGAAYNVKADKRSWAALEDFLEELFGMRN